MYVTADHPLKKPEAFLQIMGLAVYCLHDLKITELRMFSSDTP